MSRIVVDDARNLQSYGYVGKARLVFLDPPFNTGKSFQHYGDNLTDDEWVAMMMVICDQARESLQENGSLWMNLDETMHGYARMMLDKIFGRKCHVATVQWQKKYKPAQSRGIHTVHNPIIVYSKREGWRRANGMEPNRNHVAKYKNPDGDPEGPWRLTHNGERTYLEDLYVRGAMPHTWWTYDDVGHTEQAVKEVRDECGWSFSTPKPLALMRRIVKIATDPGDAIIDPMVGSGTTLVAAQELGRFWFGIEREEDTVKRFVLPRLALRNWP